MTAAPRLPRRCSADAAAAAAAWRLAAAAAWDCHPTEEYCAPAAASSAPAVRPAGAPKEPSKGAAKGKADGATRGTAAAAAAAAAAAPEAGVEGAAPLREDEAAAVQFLREVTAELQELCRAWDAVPASGMVDGQARVPDLVSQDADIRERLKACPFGDPSDSASVRQHGCGDPAVKAHDDASRATIAAQLARVCWEIRCAEALAKSQEMKAKGSPPAPEKGKKLDPKEALGSSLVSAAVLQMRLFDLVGAGDMLRRAVALGCNDPRIGLLARYSSQLLAPQDEGLLSGIEGVRADSPDAVLLQGMRRAFLDAGYTTRSVLAATGAASLCELAPPEGPAEHFEQRLSQARRAADSSGRLADLIRIFLLHRLLPLARARELLGAGACKMLLRLRLLSAVEGAECDVVPAAAADAALGGDASRALQVFSNVAIWPVEEDLLIATDFQQTLASEKLEPVKHISEESLALACSAPREEVGSVLDVCCGSGVQGIVALRCYADRATFVDLSPRAVKFTWFNLAFNSLLNKARGVHQGSVFEALPKTSSGFGAILASPPCAPNPHKIASSACAMYSDGGATGDQVWKRVVAGAPRLLAPGGRLVLVGSAINAQGLPARLQELCSGAAVRGLVFHGPPSPAAGAVPVTSPAEAWRFKASLRHAGVSSVSEAIVVLVAGGGQGGRAGPSFSFSGSPRPNLWADHGFLQTVVRSSLGGLAAAEPQAAGVKEAPPQQRAPVGAGAGAPAGDAEAAMPAAWREALEALGLLDDGAGADEAADGPLRWEDEEEEAEDGRQQGPLEDDEASAQMELLQRLLDEGAPCSLPGFQAGFFPADHVSPGPGWEETAEDLQSLRAALHAARMMRRLALASGAG